MSIPVPSALSLVLMCALVATGAPLRPRTSDPRASESVAQVPDPARAEPVREQDGAELPTGEGTDLGAEQALLDRARAAIARADYAAARQGAAEAIDRLLSKPESDRGEPWLGLLEDAGQAAWDAQDPWTAKQAREQVLEVRARGNAEDDPELQRARVNLAGTLFLLGDVHGARDLYQRVLEIRTRTLPSDQLELQVARLNLALTTKELGDLRGALALEETALEVLARTLPADHLQLQMVKYNLAGTLAGLGDLDRARELEESVLEVFSRTLSEDHPRLQAARQNLAITLLCMGDVLGAQVLLEQVLEVLSRILPTDHPDLHRARLNLAAALQSAGDLHGARALVEEVLAAPSRRLPADHPELQAARQTLAGILSALGDWAAARDLEADLLEEGLRTLPSDHRTIQILRQNLAATTYGSGDLRAARDLGEQVLEVHTRTLPTDHPDVAAARLNLAVTLARSAASAHDAAGVEGEPDWSRARALVAEVTSTFPTTTRSLCWTASLREAEERVARGALRPLGLALSFARGLGRFEPSSELLAMALELSETSRAVGLAGAALARVPVEPEERERLAAEVRAAGEELARLAQGGGTREEYHRARMRREEAERELLALVRERAREGLGSLEVSSRRLAEALGPGRALVGFRAFARLWLQEPRIQEEGGEARLEMGSRWSLGAFVLRSVEGEPGLAFVDLGALADVEEAVHAWRVAIGARGDARDRSLGGGVADGRGIGLLDLPVGAGIEEATRLRRLVWDPLVDALGDARQVVVALDDVVHLIPLDALPLDEGGELVGDRWRFESRVALWVLLDAPRPPSDRAALVSLGGASFDSQPLGLDEGERAAIDAGVEDEWTSANEPAIALLRGGAWERGFAPLSYARREALGLAELFEQTFGGISEESFEGEAPALLLEGSRASRAALVGAAPKARYLHVATHGWFAPESVRSWADVDDVARAGDPVVRMSGEETVRGMSPMLLCGLALAGANLPVDALGRVPGLMTAEELSGLDLTGCELAVLSACDTNVGERRAGQGVASLQKALHMAGARSVITSLWKVPDEATAELMLDFYRRLWVENKPKHQALWEAKMRLRDAKDERGQPLYTVRDWAAWVLSGEPD